METAKVKTGMLSGVLRRVESNPIIHKELKSRMRGAQGFLILFAYLALIGFFISAIYILLALGNGLSSSDPSFPQTIGKVIFSVVTLLELLMLAFIGPALTSGAISSERERKTFDLLRVSLLSARSIVIGKLGAAAAFLLLLVFTALPLQSLALFLGGVGAAEIFISSLMLAVTVLFFCALGLFFSSFSRRVLVSTVLSYGSILIFTVLFALLLAFINLLGILEPSNAVWEELLNAAVWLLLSTNPFFAAIVSEIILTEEQSLFFTANSFLGTTSSFPLPSPWIVYVVFHIALSALLLSLSVYFVAQPDQ
ncbi:MAG: ABC transporter permease [Chloroflexi bacterium]|nr:ABC transporter permease [Chloroflexota bacterium]